MSKQVPFDRSLYLPAAVEAAAAAYADFAEIKLTSTDDAIVADISNVAEHDPDLLVNAFCNHVLYETIARSRQAQLQEVS